MHTSNPQTRLHFYGKQIEMFTAEMNLRPVIIRPQTDFYVKQIETLGHVS
jgi:hypothetical protein